MRLPLISILGILLLSGTLSFSQETKTSSKEADKPVAKKLSPDELEKLLDSRQNILFLDVREPDEIQTLGTLEGYVNIPLGQLENRLGEIPKDKLIITACNHGVRSAQAAALLEKNGFRTLGACGLAEWKEKGKKVIYPTAEKKKS
jgi:rhodanese-related sulfurtransferase